MKVKITRSTFADGKSVSKGDTVELSDGAARELIALGKAVGTGKDAPKTPEVENAKLDTSAVEVENASATPKFTGKSVLHPHSREK